MKGDRQITDKLAARAQLAANCVPLLLIWRLGPGEVYPLLLLYWAENVIYLAFAVAQICAARHCSDRAGAILWTFVYLGSFCCLHFAFLRGFFVGSSAPGFLSGFVLALFALCLSHLINFVGYLQRKDYLNDTGENAAFVPFLHIVVLQVTLLVAGLLVTKRTSPVPAALVLSLLKIAIDAVARRVRSVETPAEREEMKCRMTHVHFNGGRPPDIAHSAPRASAAAREDAPMRGPANTSLQSREDRRNK